MRIKVRGICCRVGCDQPSAATMALCFDHAFPDSPIPWPERKVRQVFQWDIICLLCGDRRGARGTTEQARVTMAALRPCSRCGGSLIVENAEVGAISSPQAVHSSIYQPGYGIPNKPEVAA